MVHCSLDYEFVSFLLFWLTFSTLHRCDEIHLDGSRRPALEDRGTYSHAQKMRAAMTYAFGRLYGLGSLPWHENESLGRMIGNPSVSNIVSSYMVSLRRRKVSVTDYIQ
jgi:hypothetical protein